MFPGYSHSYSDPRPIPPPMSDFTSYQPQCIHPPPPPQYPSQDRYNYPPGLSRPEQPPSSYYPPHFAIHHPFH